MEKLKKIKFNLWKKLISVHMYLHEKLQKASEELTNESGQGTTEYAILVGVLVVIAILAIAIFRPKLEELWNAIAEGINGL